MVGVGDPEAIQVRFSEARVVRSAFIAKTTAFWGSSSKVGGVPVTAQEQLVCQLYVSKNITLSFIPSL